MRATRCSTRTASTSTSPPAPTSARPSVGLDMSPTRWSPAASTWRSLKKTSRRPSRPKATKRRSPTRRRRTKTSGREDRGADEAAQGRPADQRRPRSAAKTPKVVIDIDDIGQRILGAAGPGAQYHRPPGWQGEQLFIVEAPLVTRAMPPSGPTALTIQKYDLNKRKLDKVVEGVSAFDVSANGEKMLYRQRQNGSSPRQPAQPAKPGEGAAQDGRHRGRVDPARRVEPDVPRGVAHRARLLLRPELHGLDLQAAEKKYEPYLEERRRTAPI